MRCSSANVPCSARLIRYELPACAVWLILVPGMLKKFLTLSLLTLALSPFNAPFHIGATAQEVASIEQLSAVRHHLDSRALIARRSSEAHGALGSLSHSTFAILLSNRPIGVLPRATGRSPATGGSLALAAVLRL